VETLSKAIFGIALALLGALIPQVETPTPDTNERIVATDTVQSSDCNCDSRLTALESRVSSLESKYGSYTAPVKATTSNYGSSGSAVSQSSYTPVYTEQVTSSSQTCVKNPDGTVTCESSYSGPQYKTGPLGILRRRVQ